MLHMLFYVRSAGSLDLLLDTEGGAQDSRVVGGTQLISKRMAEDLGDPSTSKRRSGGSSGPATRCMVLADGLQVTADAGRRRAAAGTRRPHQLRTGPAGGPRRADPADDPGQRDQDDVDLPRTVLAGPRVSPARRPAPTARCRSSSTTRRPTAARECCSLSSKARPPATPADLPQAGPPAARHRLPGPAVRRRGGQPGPVRGEGLGGRRVVPRLLRRLPAARAPGPRTARRSGNRSARSTGPAPRPPANGPDTWKARSSRAAAPPARSWSRRATDESHGDRQRHPRLVLGRRASSSMPARRSSTATSWSRPGPTSSTSAVNRPGRGPRRSRPKRSCGGSCRWSKAWPAPSRSRSTRPRRRSRRPRSTAAPRSSTTSPDSAATQDMAALCAERGVEVVLMHMLGTPRTMQDDPTYDDVVAEVRDFLLERVELAGRGGDRPREDLDRSRDRLRQDARPQPRAAGGHGEFAATGLPVLVGPSRKAFIGKIDGSAEDRPAGRDDRGLPRGAAPAAPRWCGSTTWDRWPRRSGWRRRSADGQ